MITSIRDVGMGIRELNAAEAAERGAPVSVVSVLSAASVVQSPYIMVVIGKLKTYVDKPVARCHDHTKQTIGGDL